MVFEIRLPPYGQTSDEMTIIEWYKNEGDTVDLAEPLLCVETDKAQVDVESAEAGTVLRIVAQPGEVLVAGALLAYVGAPGDDAPSPHVAGPSATDAAASPSAAASPLRTGSPLAPPAPAGAPPAAVANPERPAGGRVQALPAVRKLAAELGVDLATVTGTGPNGIIERADVERAVATRSPAPAAPTAAGAAPPAEVGEPSSVPPIRRAMARRLTRSAQNIPTFRLAAHLDATAATTALGASGNGLTYTHLLLRCVARALRDHPVMLRLWVDDGPKYRTLPAASVGLAVAGDDSLSVVTIANPDQLALPVLVESVTAAAGRARAGALSKADKAPATITVSNLGMFAVDAFDAVIDPDQNAVLATASVRDRVVAVDGVPTVVPQLTVNLACDHRCIDGAHAARYLHTLRGYFETDPAGPSR